MSLWLKIVQSVSADEAAKSAKKRAAAEAAADAALGARAAPAAPTPDPFVALEEHLRTIDQVHAQTEAEARAAYLDLLARMLPPRTGPAPPADAHALAVSPGDPPPPARVLVILRAANKTPDDLRREVKLLATLRDQADLAAQHDARLAAERAADDALRALREAFEAVEADWAARIEIQRRLAQDATSRRHESYRAAEELERAQGITAELREIRGPSIPDRDLAPPELLAEDQACNEARAELRARSLRLAELERVVFPPPPEPAPKGVRHEGSVLYYTPRDGS